MFSNFQFNNINSYINIFLILKLCFFPLRLVKIILNDA